ncbi:MAG: heparin lyase I family protein [Gaiellaceae bacterium]
MVIPTISGTTQQGQVLTSSIGTWEGTQPFTFSYQWKRCDNDGNTCSDINGALASSYSLTAADVGSTIRIQITASNSVGSSIISSNSTAIITPVVAATTTPGIPTPYLVDTFETGDLTKWSDFSNAGLSRTPSGMQVVPVPNTDGSSTQTAKVTVATGGLPNSAAFLQTNSYQLPWAVIGADVWHRMRVLFPSGANPAYPGKFTVDTPGGWNTVIAWHNRTDAATGPYGNSYLSSMVMVHNNADGTARLQLRTAGGTPQVPVLTYIPGPTLQYDHWYDIQVRFVLSEQAAVGYYEWWVNNSQIATGKAPTAYKLPDGTSGQLFQVGHYRSPDHSTSSGTLYIDDVTVGPTRASTG